MRIRWWVLVSYACVLSACGWIRPPKPPGVDPASAFDQIQATAPLGMSLNDLGRPFDKNFQRLQGADGAILFQTSKQPAPTAQNLMKHELLIVEDGREFAANASAWGVVGSLGTSSTQRYASYRAISIRDVYEIDDTTAMRQAPKGAVYYPARIYYGHLYEVVLSGSEDTFDVGVAAQLGVFSGGIDRFAKQNNLKLQAIGRGLKPTTGKAIFARTQEEIEKNYGADGQDAVPILVEWRVIPKRTVAPQKIVWKQVEKNCAGNTGCEPCKRWEFFSIEYTAPQRNPLGNAWDALGGLYPDLVLFISAGGDKRTTSEQQNRFYGSWNFDPSLEVDVGVKINISAIDVDMNANDPIADFSAQTPQRIDLGAFRIGSATLYGQCIDPPVIYEEYDPGWDDPE
jgi:hypothetical protein